MSGSVWVRLRWAPARKPFHPAIESSPRVHRTETYASHIRGRIGRPRPGWRSNDGYAHYEWEVYNSETGKVLVCSDSFGLTDAIADCSHVVGLARSAAFWSFWKPDKS